MPKVLEVRWGVTEYSFKSFNDLEEFFLDSFETFAEKGLLTKAIGKKLFVFKKEKMGNIFEANS